MHYFIISSICFTYFFLHFNTVRATSPHIFALHNILGSRPRARMLSCSASLLERVTTYVRTAPIALHQTRMACHVRLYSNERFRVKLYCFPLCFVSVYWTFRSPVTMYYPNRKTRRIFTQICREIGRFSQKVSWSRMQMASNGRCHLMPKTAKLASRKTGKTGEFGRYEMVTLLRDVLRTSRVEWNELLSIERKINHKRKCPK
jgi:hypothetical protein